MGSFKSFGKRANGGGFGPKPFMHQAVCASCGKQCEVPFKPAPGRDVFCKECFANHKPGAQRSEGNSFQKPRFNDAPRPAPVQQNTNQFKEQLAAMNTKLDTLIALLTKKAESTPAAEKQIKEKVVAKKAPVVKAKSSTKKVAKKKKK